jgi:predicted type IV restriction endonuclease
MAVYIILEEKMQSLKITRNEIIERNNKIISRYPNLVTVLMVEKFLEKHRDMPMKITEIRNKLPRQMMHQTLKIILEYLWKSGKIIYGPKGIQWIYTEPEHIKLMMEDSLEV